MSYSLNPHLPKVRRDAVLYADTHGIRAAARKYGYSPGAVCKWAKKARLVHGYSPIPTQTSRPHSSPHAISNELGEAIAQERLKLKRCAEVVHRSLLNQGHTVSLSTVKRTLDRRYLTKKRSPWKRLHISPERPETHQPGDLIQIDTVHRHKKGETVLYIFTCIDVHSRWAFSRCYTRANCHTASQFLKNAQRAAPFVFKYIQSDNGSEFSQTFTQRAHMPHRHSRVRTPNDNAHLERFNRTVQEECLDNTAHTLHSANAALKKYIDFYNSQRLHLGLQLQTPLHIISKCFQGVG
jgi:transposase InsO family protein